MRNPNGYGSVTRLSGTRRKPYWVKKTVGWDEKGYPIYSTIGYTETREEGLILLAQYNKEPWDVDKAKTTLSELFNLWKEKKMPKLSISSQNACKTSYKYCQQYADMKYKDLRLHHMQDSIDNCGRGYSTQGAIKTLWSHLDDFAFELDIVNRCYSKLLTCEPIPETRRSNFTNDEITSTWNVYERYKRGEEFNELPVEWVDTILIFIYSGFRLRELLDMKTSDVDLESHIFKGGKKSSAGKNRIVPIHSLIYNMVQERVEQGNEFLLSYDGGKKPPNSYYYKIWKQLADYIGFDKTPHECRHTFETMLDSAGANRKCIDLMMGHKSKDVGERVYTHKTIDELRNAIELVTR